MDAGWQHAPNDADAQFFSTSGNADDDLTRLKATVSDNTFPDVEPRDANQSDPFEAPRPPPLDRAFTDAAFDGVTPVSSQPSEGTATTRSSGLQHVFLHSTEELNESTESHSVASDEKVHSVSRNVGDFKPPEQATDLDWMNTGTEQISSEHEPVTGIGVISGEPLMGGDVEPMSEELPERHLQAIHQSTWNHDVSSMPSGLEVAGSEGQGQLEPTDFETIDTEPAEIIQDVMPQTLQSQEKTSLERNTTYRESEEARDEEIPSSGSPDAEESNPSDWLQQADDVQAEGLFEADNPVDEWAKEMGRSHGKVDATAEKVLSEQYSENEIPDDSWMNSQEPSTVTEEDSWAKAFDSTDDSWAAAFGDDDDGFLEDEPEQTEVLNQPTTSIQTNVLPTQVSRTSSSISSSQTNSYTPAPIPSQPQQTQRKPPSGPMQFFEDLPTSSSRSRRPKQQVFAQSQPSGPPPPSQDRQIPARQSSFGQSQYGQFQQPPRLDPFPPQPSVSPSTTTTMPPSAPSISRYSPAPSEQSSISQPSIPREAPKLAPTSSSSQNAAAALSYDTLEVKARPKSRSSYTRAPPSQPNHSPPLAQTSSPLGPLRPEAPHAPTQGVSAQTPNTSSRYSPAPSSQPARSASYAATPLPSSTNQMPPPSGSSMATATSRFAPRTSSPLAQHNQRPMMDRSATAPSIDTEEQPAQQNRMSPPVVSPPTAINRSISSIGTGDPQSPPTQVASLATISQYQPKSAPQSQQPPRAAPQQSMSPETTAFDPPQRSQTSSPGSAMAAYSPSKAHPPRPASVQAQTAAPPLSNERAQIQHFGHKVQSEVQDFVLPNDETGLDPLQRWKGSPIFRWGPGGIVTFCSPQHVTRYGGGQSAPKVKSVPGEVKLKRMKEVLPEQQSLVDFPGPLKSKSKKKDLVSWLSQTVENMKKQLQSGRYSAQEWTRLEERIILWNVVKVFVEHDGTFSGSTAVDTAIRDVLAPPKTSNAHTSPIAPTSASPVERRADLGSTEQLKQLLLQAEREKAVWHAVDNKLWSHALLISSTVSPTVWKQVVQEFVRKEVRNPNQDNQSLAALYEVFAGNSDECVDELVSLSARSGFQMVSTADNPGSARDALEGLNKWRETLTLIMGNRSTDDERSLVALGNLLASYGRIEAAHICYIFARSNATFGGADDQQTHFSLLGLNHTNPSPEFDMDSIVLSEAYEFGLSLSGSSASYYVPHLQAYKLQHAYALAEMGQRSEALQYCDAIASAMKSTTRVSPYYHSLLGNQVDDLYKRLSQSPKDSGSGWTSKPSIAKVSNSVGNWLTNFVAGDDDTVSTGSGPHSEAEPGPFSRLPGGTPTISRSASNVDLHSDHSKGYPIPQVNSRYAPNVYSQRPGFEQESNYSSSPEQRFNYSPHLGADGSSYGSPPNSSHMHLAPSHLSQYQSYRPTSSSSRSQLSNSYEPYVPTVQEETQAAYPGANEIQPSSYTSEPTPAVQLPQATEVKDEHPYTSTVNGFALGANGYQPSVPSFNPVGNDSIQGGYEPSAENYEPPTGGYEPYSYQPYSPNTALPEEDGPQAGNEPKSIMDEGNDDFEIRSAALKKQNKAKKDKEAEENFRKAAEADAARDKPKRSSSGGGWFGGISSLWGSKKDPSAPAVHKVKLGEESSFYFDAETKRWVNRKDPSGSQSTSTGGAGTPPPPKAGMGGPPRSTPPPRASHSPAGASKPPSIPPSSTPLSAVASVDDEVPISASGPDSRSDTPSSTAVGGVEDLEQTPTATSIPALNPPSAPPSRPSTGMSGASELDDLIQPGGSGGSIRKKGKKKGGGRYLDPMADAQK